MPADDTPKRSHLGNVCSGMCDSQEVNLEDIVKAEIKLETITEESGY